MKRKLIYAVLTAALCAALMTACGSSKEEAAPEAGEPAAEETAESEDAGQTAAIANPWVYTDDAEEAETEAGFAFNCPEGAEDVVYGVLTADLNGDGYEDKLLEMSFYDEAGTDITARMASTAGEEDISGMESTAIEWDTEDACTVAGFDACLRTCSDNGEGNTVMLVTWYDAVPGIAYSLCAWGPDLNGFDPIGMAETVYLPMQGES